MKYLSLIIDAIEESSLDIKEKREIVDSLPSDDIYFCEQQQVFEDHDLPFGWQHG